MNDNFSELKENEKQSGWLSNGNWVLGAGIIVVGVVLLLRNIIGFEFDNWWVLFMLIPLAMMGVKAWQDWQVNGRVNTGSVIPILGILVIITVSLFNLSWSAIWPVYFIIGGLSILLGSRK
ncbi:MAG: hypothetical protein H6658_05540 [Ardenticatenaceae bacterium]|nr:hypothetical protein [Ardenticatenaceae bacterium]